MNFKEYEERARKFALYPDAGLGTKAALSYTTIGLCGESGEYAEKIKKFLRDGYLDNPLALKELGDVLWYITACAHEIGWSLTDVAEVNLVKLEDRVERGKLQGSGDSR